MLFSCGGYETIEQDKLLKRNDTYYKVNSDEPFTGKAIQYFTPEDKQSIRSELMLKNGKPDGKIIRYYLNGQKKEELLIDPESPSIAKKEWAENGQLLSETSFNYNSKSGIERKYYTSGQLWVEWDLDSNKVMNIHKHYLPNGEKVEGETLKDGTGIWLNYLKKGTLGQIEQCEEGDCQNAIFGSYQIGDNVLSLSKSKYGKSIHLKLEEEDKSYRVDCAQIANNEFSFYHKNDPYSERRIKLSPNWKDNLNLGKVCIGISRVSGVTPALAYDGEWCRSINN